MRRILVLARLGHPLGGNGVESLVWAHADVRDATLRIDARAYVRERGPYNLYSPELQGYGHGGRVAAAWRFGSGIEALGSLELERLGNRQIRNAAFFGARVLF